MISRVACLANEWQHGHIIQSINIIVEVYLVLLTFVHDVKPSFLLSSPVGPNHYYFPLFSSLVSYSYIDPAVLTFNVFFGQPAYFLADEITWIGQK